MKLDQHKIKIIGIYTLLLAGGLWHLLGVLQNAMRWLAAPMIIALCLLLCAEHLHAQRNRKFILWGAGVCIMTFMIELAGVKTGALFGSYVYGETLQPQLWKVPLAIGFAWLALLISATVVSQYLLPYPFLQKPALAALLIALLMVLFDFFMEPAATKLGYWTWNTGAIPWQNYFAWFVFGFILSYIGLRLGLFMKKASPVAAHAYFAQLGYFMLVRWS